MAILAHRIAIALPRNPPLAGLARLWTGIRLALLAIETRRQLAGLDDRMLRDIGISHADALREAERAPWDLSLQGSRRG